MRAADFLLQFVDRRLDLHGPQIPFDAIADTHFVILHLAAADTNM